MEVNVEDVSKLTKKMKIVVPQNHVSKMLNEAYKNLNSEVSIKGFRKGKVPLQILKKSYGDKVEQDVGEKLIQETYFDALEEVKLDAVVHPDIKSHEFADDGTFIYEAEIDVRPEFELGLYKGLEIEQPEIVIPDEEVVEALETMRQEIAPLRTVEDRAVTDGDLVVINFQGFHDGTPLKEVTAENYSVDVGSGRNGKEFEEQLLGLEKGDNTTKEVDFPADFPNPVLADKKIEFKIEVKDIKERILAEIDDEFAKDAGEEFTTLEDLKNHIRAKKLEERQEAQKGDVNDRIMMKLVDSHEFEVPNRLVAYEVNELIKELESNLKSRGMTLESAGMNTDDLVKQYRESAERRIKGDFILKKIGEVEEVKLADEDINKGFGRVAEKYGMTIEEVKKYFRRREDLLPFMSELLSEKILKFLSEQCIIKPVSPQSEEASS